VCGLQTKMRRYTTCTGEVEEKLLEEVCVCVCVGMCVCCVLCMCFVCV